MKKVYKYQNGTIYVSLSNTYDHEIFKKVTEEFLKKVISEEKKNGNTNKTWDNWKK